MHQIKKLWTRQRFHFAHFVQCFGPDHEQLNSVRFVIVANVSKQTGCRPLIQSLLQSINQRAFEFRRSWVRFIQEDRQRTNARLLLQTSST